MAKVKKSRKPARAPRAVRVMWATMVNDHVVPRSICNTRVGAASYLGDARHAVRKLNYHVRVVKLTIEEVPQLAQELPDGDCG